MKRLIALFGLALLLAALAPMAQAHTRSQSFSSWLIDGANVRASFTVSDTETKALSKDGGIPDTAALMAYLVPKIGASVAKQACATSFAPQMVSAQPGFRRIEWQFHCPSASGITLHDAAFFDLVPTHFNLAQIRKPDSSFIEQLFTASTQSLDLSTTNGRSLENAGFFTFIMMGIMHIFTGLDHQSFLLGLVLISRRLKDLVFVVTGFTLGHSLTLALAVTGIIRPHAEFIDALVALTIILIGIDNVTAATRKPAMIAAITGGLLLLMWGLRLAGIGILPPALLLGSAIFTACYLMISGNMQDAGRLRLMVTLVFGLIHGFGFAADLLESNVPAGRLAELLIGFNLGVEAGQLCLIAAVTLLVMALVKIKFTIPRPLVVDTAAALLVGIGMTWFVARSFV